ncbi:MAG: hypothetical protein HXY20_04130 [Acidobacteria bacterium]|nr:hypothetical protein [Acidobacteriota bacterium]
MGTPFRSVVLTIFSLTAMTLILALPRPSCHAQGKAPGPSLDRLVARVLNYWELLLQGKKLQAMSYVEETGRPDFVARQMPSFSEPRIVRLDPAAGGREVLVTVEVKRTIPPLRAPVNWPVTERWVFQKGEWFVVVPKASPALFSSGKGGQSAASAEEIEARKRTILERVRFDRTEIDLGTIRKPGSASAPVKYQLAGDESMDLEFVNAPVDLMVRGMESRQLKPGGPQSIELELLTANYPHGKVEQEFTILVSYRGASVPYQFRLSAQVYAAVSCMPPALAFGAGEKEKDVLVSNNSSSEVRIDSAYSESGGFEITPLPSAISPGQAVTLRVKLVKPLSKNHRERLELHFGAAVEDMQGLTIPVVVQPPIQPVKSGPEPTPAQIEKLLRKAPPPRSP